MEPMTPPSATLDASSQPPCLRITGDWTLAHYASLRRESEQLRAQYPADTVADLSQLGRLDTAGASLLAELLGSERLSTAPKTCPKPAVRCSRTFTARCRTTASRSRNPSAMC